MTDVNILINALQNGERVTSENGDTFNVAPNRTALHAARALKQFADIINNTQPIINNLQHQVNTLMQENESLRQQLEKLNEVKTSNDAANVNSDLGSSEPNNEGTASTS